MPTKTIDPSRPANPNTPAPIDLNNPLDRPHNMEVVLQSRREDLTALLGDDKAVDRFIRTTVHVLAANPSLLALQGNSILLSVLEAARMGLEPVGRFGGAYLIPRKGKAVLEVDWRGFIRMAQREGAIRSASADVVYAGDQFAYRRGTDPRIDHYPTRGPAFGEPERGDVTHFYAILYLPDGSFTFEVMTKAEVEAIRRRSPASEDGPWVTDYIEMGRKTVVRRVFKYVPAVYNPGLQYALEREDKLEGEATFQDERSGHSVRRQTLAARIAGEDDPASGEQTEPPAEPEAEAETPGGPVSGGQPVDTEEGLPE